MNAEQLIKGFRATERAGWVADGINFYTDPNEHVSVTFLGNAWQMDSRSRENIPKRCTRPWLAWLSGLRAGLQTKRLLVRFPVRAHVWVAD